MTRGDGPLLPQYGIWMWTRSIVDESCSTRTHHTIHLENNWSLSIVHPPMHLKWQRIRRFPFRTSNMFHSCFHCFLFAKLYYEDTFRRTMDIVELVKWFSLTLQDSIIRKLSDIRRSWYSEKVGWTITRNSLYPHPTFAMENKSSILFYQAKFVLPPVISQLIMVGRYQFCTSRMNSIIA